MSGRPRTMAVALGVVVASAGCSRRSIPVSAEVSTTQQGGEGGRDPVASGAIGAKTGDAGAVVDKDGDAMADVLEGRGSKERLASLHAWLDRAAAQGYEPLSSFKQLRDGRGVEGHSRMWMGRLLSASANPYAAEAVTVRTFHAASADMFDVLRHEYSAHGMDVVLFETLDFCVLVLRSGAPELGALGRQDKIDRINELARKLLAVDGVTSWPGNPEPYHWTFQFPKEIGEGSKFSTNPGAESRLFSSWSDCAEGGIRRGRLYFMLYKREEATSGKLISHDPTRWFSGEYAEPYRGIKTGGSPRR